MQQQDGMNTLVGFSSTSATNISDCKDHSLLTGQGKEHLSVLQLEEYIIHVEGTPRTVLLRFGFPLHQNINLIGGISSSSGW